MRLYDGPKNDHDVASALAIDGSGNVYVTGRSWNQTSSYLDFATIKYAPNGDSLWVRRYNGPGNYDDRPSALALDGSGNVYVIGYSYGSGTSSDYVTIKYAPDGDTLWVRRYNGLSNDYDVATALAVDDSGNVYVTGVTDTSGGLPNSNFATLKYTPDGDTLWVRRYNGPGKSSDVPYALAVDGNGNVYVTGYSWSGNSYDYATLKYITCLFKSGDIAKDGIIAVVDLVTLINHLFKRQPAPEPLCLGDVNADGKISPSDLIYLINFLFKHGPVPLKSGACCL